MTGDKRQPPELATWLLRWTIPCEDQEAILGDLEESFCERRRAAGRLRSALWYWKETLGIATEFGLHRWKTRRRRRWADGAKWLTGLGMDIRVARRALAKSYLQTAVAVVALGLGIGLATTTFTIVYGTLLRGLPLERSDQLVHFSRRSVTEQHDLAVVPHDYIAWREGQTSFERLGAYVEAIVHLSGDDGVVERFNGLALDASGLELLRAQPLLGRLYDADDDVPGAPPVVLLSHTVWETRFAADRNILGEAIRLNGVPTLVIGVMSPNFGFPVAEKFWMPLRLDASRYAIGEGRLDVVGRLRSGVSIDEARPEIEAISRRLEADHPATHAGIRPQLRTFTEEYVGGRFTRLATTMLGGALLVLLVACVNVAGLFLAQSLVRARDVSLRLALGASRLRLVSQFLVESMLVAALGGVLGTVLAHGGVAWFERVFVQLGDAGLPHGPELVSWWRFELDAVPIAFAMGLTVFVSLLAGLAPALRASRGELHDALAGGGARVATAGLAALGRGLVVTQVALTMALLVATGLSVRSVANTVNVDWGMRAESVMTARIALPSGDDSDYPDAASRRRFWTRLRASLLGQPGLEHASLISTLPLRRAIPTPFRIQGRAALNETDPLARHATISRDLFVTLGTRVQRGEDLPELPAGRAVVLINASFRDRYFPDEDALGQQIRIGREPDERWRTVVGIVPDLWMDGPSNEQPEGLYIPIEQSIRVSAMSLVVRVKDGQDPTRAVATMRETVRQLDSELPVYQVRTMTERISEATGRFEVYGAFYAAFGLAALLLASLGLYGLSSFLVERRRREIGLRMALGASRWRVVLQVARQTALPLIAGGTLGAGLAVVLAGQLSTALFEVDPLDPTVYAVIALVLGTAGLTASLVPARRATRIDPLTALREE